MIAVVVLVPLGVGLYLHFGGSPETTTDTDAIEKIAAALTAEQVAAMDKTEAFYAYFIRAAQESKAIATTAATITFDGGTEPKGTTI